MPNDSRSLVLRYGLAAVSIALAVCARLLLDPLLGIQFPFATVFFAVLLTAWYGGFGPALVAVVFGGLCADYFLIPPRGSFGSYSLDQGTGMALYVATSLGIALLGGAMRAASQRAEASAQAERHQREQLRVTFTSIGDAVITTGAEGRIVSLNGVAEALTGWKQGEAEGRALEEVFVIGDETTGQVAASPATRVLREGVVVGLANHNILLARDGAQRPIDGSAAPVLDDKGVVIGSVLIFRDVSERRRLEKLQSDLQGQLERQVEERTAELRTSEERLASIIGSAMDGIITVDEQHRITLLNAAAEKMFGCSFGEVLGQPLGRLIPERFRAGHEGHIREFARTRVTRRVVGALGAIYGLRADGQEFPIEASISQAEVAGQRLFTVILRDITDWKQAEEALQASENRLRQVIDLVPHFVFAKDIEGRFVLVNRATAEAYGTTVEGLTGKSDADFARSEEEVRRFRADDLEVTRSGRPMIIPEESITDAQGRVRLLQTTKIPFTFSGTTSPAVLGVAVDITEQKRADEERRDSEARLQAALAASDMGTWIWHIQKGTFWGDDFVLSLLGRTREELADGTLETFLSALHPEDRAQVRSALEAAAREPDRDYEAEYRVIRPDGTLRWIGAKGRTERDAAGRPLRLIGVNLDTTARKRAAESQGRSQKMEALGTLAGGIAHDFNNILSAITGNTKLAIADLPARHPVQESLVEVAKASARAADLVRRILSFTRQQELQREVVQLGPVVQEALKLLRSTLPAMLEIRTGIPPDLPVVAADSGQVHQILMNLVTNSAHAIGHGVGLIQVDLEALTVSPELARASTDLREGRYVRLSVSDNGCGMDKPTLERIFDPFFTTKPPGQGTGLGLSAVHGIMRSHEGSVTVYSQPAKGTTFRLYFPAVDSAGVKREAPPPDVSRGRGQRVLYVDDEDALVLLTTRTLDRLGYRVTGYSDPAQALQAFRSRPQDFDVVVTDLSMPGMSGFDLARELLATRPDIFVVMTSGYLRPEDQRAATQIGIGELVLKPTSVEGLGQVLERLFRSHPPRAAPRIREPPA